MNLQIKEPVTYVAKSVEHYYESLLSALPRIALGIFIVVTGILIAQIITNFYRKQL